MVRSADTGPVAAGFWRLALAVPLMLVIARAAGGTKIKVPFGKAMIVTIMIGGMFFAADLAAWHLGIHSTKLANATLFGNLSALLFPVYGFIIARALPRPMQGLALGLALVGGALLLGGSYELSRKHLVGDLLAILAGVFYTIYLISIERARRALAPMPVLALSSSVAAVPLLIAAIMLGETVWPDNWTPLLLLALGSQVIGQGLLVYAMGHLSPLVVGLGFLIQPLVTAGVGWIVYDELLSLTDGIGGLLICGALVLIRLPGDAER